MSRTVQRLRPYVSTIFAEMTELAIAHEAINLGQGFPDIDGPREVLDAAAEAMAEAAAIGGEGLDLAAVNGPALSVVSGPVDRLDALQAALDDWAVARPKLEAVYQRLNDGLEEGAFAFDQTACHSPLPRAYHWADGSAYVNHVELVRKAIPPRAVAEPDHRPAPVIGERTIARPIATR